MISFRKMKIKNPFQPNPACIREDRLKELGI